MGKPLRALLNRDSFAEWLNDNGLTGLGVEIGTFHGEYAEKLLATWQGQRLFCVDPWKWMDAAEYLDGCNVRECDEVYAKVVDTLGKNTRCTIYRERSTEAIGRFDDGALSFCYLDGNHDLSHVREDLQIWWPKIKQGGVLGGHDLYIREDEFQRCGVFDAVWEFAHQIDHRPHVTNCTSWWFVKT